MINGELGRTQLKFPILQRVASGGKKVNMNNEKLPNLMLE